MLSQIPMRLLRLSIDVLESPEQCICVRCNPRVADDNLTALLSCVQVVGNPCNTNALIALTNAPSLNPKNFHALTRLDEVCPPFHMRGSHLAIAVLVRLLMEHPYVLISHRL